MFEAFCGRGIFWKEWRAKARMMVCLAAAVFVGTPLAVALLRTNTFTFFERSNTDWVAASATIFALSAIALGAMLIGREEQDPARAYLYVLPVSRRRILAAKLAALASQWLALLLALGLIYLWVGTILGPSQVGHSAPPSDMPSAGKPHDQIDIWLTVLFVCFGLIASLLAAILSLHVRSAILTVFLAIFGILPLVMVLRVFASGSENLFDGYVRSFVCAMVLFLVLVAWLFFAFCRTPLQELGPTPRTLLALLFIVALAEFAFTVFLCDWRDLVFIAFGI
jgi:hypothetical protein